VQQREGQDHDAGHDGEAHQRPAREERGHRGNLAPATGPR
jgi:hypothetical protein